MIWTILAIPIIVAIVSKFFFRLDICWKEFSLQIGVCLLILGAVWGIGVSQAVTDVETRSGYVQSKEVDHFRCPMNTMNPCHNGYTCNVRTICTGTGKDRTCHTESDTCYLYPWEQDWYAVTTLGKIEVPRVDAQGAEEPARYTEIKRLDPVSRNFNYTNWLKGASRSLFKDSESIHAKYKNLNLIPKYPNQIYDLYKVDRLVTVGVNVPDDKRKEWNETISTYMTTLGPVQEMNVVVIMAEGVDQDYTRAVRYAWHGLKKNDLVLFIGTRNQTVQWVDVLSWSKNPAVDVKIRTELAGLKGQSVVELNTQQILANVYVNSRASFERRPMSDYSYLKRDFSPPAWVIFTCFFLAFALSIGLSVWFHMVDLFGSNIGYYKRNHRF